MVLGRGKPGGVWQVRNIGLLQRRIAVDPVGVQPNCYIQLCGSGRNRIHLGPWIRIPMQRYKMKRKAEFNQQIFWGFFVGNYIFKSEPKKVANFFGLGTDLKINFFSALKRWFEINLVTSLTWVRTGSGFVFIKFCGPGSAYDQSGSTSLISLV